MPDPSAPRSPAERLLLIGSVALITIAAFENLAVTTILPVIARELDGFAIYALAAGLPLALQVVANALGGILVDATSFRRPLILGVVIATAGLVIAGAAPQMWILALGRGLAGFGLGFITVALYAAVGTMVPPQRRPGFFAAFSAAWVVPSMVGPTIAGALADAGWWRAVFIGVVPLALLALVLLRPLLTHPQASSPDQPGLRRRAVRTLPLAIGLAAALAVVQAAGAADSGAASLATAGLALAAVLTLLPLLLPRGAVLLRRGVPAALAGKVALNGAVIGTQVYLPLVLQEGYGWSTTASGLVLTAGSVSWSLGAFAQSRVVGEERRHRWSVAGALLIMLGVGATASIILPVVPPLTAALGMLLVGFGMGVTSAALAVFALDHTPAPRQGEVSAQLQIAEGAGSATAIAVVGVVIAVLGRDTTGFGTALALLTGVAAASVVATWRVRNLTGPAPDSAPQSP